MSATRASLLDDFSAMRKVKAVVGIVVFLGALFFDPLGGGIDVHTPHFVVRFKYIASMGRNQDAFNYIFLCQYSAF